MGDAFASLPADNYTAVDRDDCAAGPRLEARMPRGIPAFMDRIQRNLHLFGRYGITMLRSPGSTSRCGSCCKSARVCRCSRLIRAINACADPGLSEPAFGSDAEAVAGECQTACGVGYTAIKCMRRRRRGIAAGRRSAPRPADGRHDCPLDGTEAIAFAQACRAAAPMFIEEPVWPPEDFATLGRGARKSGPQYRQRARMPVRSINFGRC